VIASRARTAVGRPRARRIGAGVHHEPGGTDIAGDALYAVAAYLAVVLIAPRLPPIAAGAVAAAWCVGVELFQLTGLPLAWTAHFAPAMLVLGTVFDARDLLVYVLTVAGCTAIDAVRGRLATR